MHTDMMEAQQSPHSTDQPRSPLVCLTCKTRKKKCSKTLPSCDLCSRLLLKCVYQSTEPSVELYSRSSSGHDRSVSPFLLRTLSPNAFEATESNHTSARLSGWHASARFLASVTSLYDDQSSPATAAFHASTIKEVLQILTDNGGSLPALFSEYFRTIDAWLPGVISQADIYRRVEREPSSELALLLLSMFLVVQLPNSKVSSQSSMYTTIYFAAKSLLSTLIGAGASSLDVVQACVLILLYEAGHGMADQAHQSLALCSRFGVKLDSSRECSGVSEVKETDDNRLWWSVIMFDRYLSLGVFPSEVNLIPSSPGSESGVLSSLYKMSDAYSPLAQPARVSFTGSLDRTAAFIRAVDILGRVSEYTKLLYTGRCLDLAKYKALDAPLQALLVELLEQSTKSWEDYCESIGLCVSALFILHKARYDAADKMADSSSDAHEKQLALMAIKSAINIVIEIAVNFNARIAYIDLPALPLPSTHTIYQAAILHVKTSFDSFGTPKWNAEMESLKISLDRFGNRWSVGKIYVQSIEDAVGQEMRYRGQNYNLVT